MERTAAALAPLMGRTAALIRRARAALPPPPDATIVAGHDDGEGQREGGIAPPRAGDRYDPYGDLFMFQRALEPWDAIWKRRPLVFHDGGLVSQSRRSLIPLPPYLGEDTMDTTEAITKILHNHPGPVESFRLDSSACPAADLLAKWLDAMSAKRARELVLFNLTRPTQTVFPLRSLRGSSLRRVAIGFFHLKEGMWLHWCPGVSSLQELSLTACTFMGRTLSAVVRDLPNLKKLTLGCIHITAAGSEEEPPEGFVIDSSSLQSLKLWECAANKLRIEFAPRLRELKTGVVPSDRARNSSVVIDVKFAHALEEITHLTLHEHIFGISDTDILSGRRITSLSYLHTLSVRIWMSKLTDLLNLLNIFPNLTNLSIWRLDEDVPPHRIDEGIGRLRDWSPSSLPGCLTHALEHLAMKSYQGHIFEIALVGGVLCTARRLVTVSLQLDPDTELTIGEAEAPFLSCPRSGECNPVVTAYRS